MSKINKYSLVKSLMFSFLVLFILVGMYGGCGSSGGGTNDGEGCCVIGPDACIDDTNLAECDGLGGNLDIGAMCSDIPQCGIVPPPTDPPPTNPPPTDPPPTNPPPTDPPPLACEIPALNSDFSDTGYFFFDPFTGLTMGVTSNGELVVIAIVDSMGVSVGAGAFPLGDFACSIFEGVVGEAVLDADGLCGKSDDSTLFLILDFKILGVPFVDEAIGECFAVEPLGLAVSQNNENDSIIDATVREVQDLTLDSFFDMQSRGELENENSDGINFADILEDLVIEQEEK